MGNAIEIEGLSKNYGSLRALKGINLTVSEGEMFAYLGPNGAGKSTTIRILTGLTKKTAGRVRLSGYDLDVSGLQVRHQFGVVHQSVNLDQELTVFENLVIHGRLYKMSRQYRTRRIEELLTYAELEQKADILVKKLSGGLKRRVTIIRALLHEPRILFLDEPTVGLDPKIRRRIWGLVKKVQQQGTTIFLTTHHIEEAEFLAERVALLDDGVIVAQDSPSSLMDQVGAWAVDHMNENGLETRYFKTREDATSYPSIAGFTLRRVNLEDAFLKLTGKKVQ